MKKLTNILKRFFILFIFVIGLAETISGTNYYISPNGVDTNNGLSPSAPFKTITAAAIKVIAGDTVFISGGTYTERVTPNSSGKPNALIVFKRYENTGDVVLTTPQPDIPNETKLYAFILTGRDYIVIDGIDFKDCNGWIYMDKANHNTVMDCSFDGSRVYSSLKINNGSWNKVIACKFIKAVDITWKGWEPAKGADFITIWRDSHYNIIEGCHFGHIPHDCIGIHGREPALTATHNIIRNCVFDNPTWKAIGLHKTEYTLVENNICFGDAANFLQFEAQKVIMRRNLFYRYHDTPKGLPEIGFRGVMRIQSVKDEYSCPNLAQHNRIYNNLFYGNERVITNFSVKLPVFDNIFKNNIFYKNHQTVLISNAGYKNESRNYFFGNVLFGTCTGEQLITLQKDKFSLKDAQRNLPDLYSGNIETGPKFISEAAGDFRLSPGSPCIDKGEALTTAKGGGKGNIITADDPLYFCDGYGLIGGDTVRIGKNPPLTIRKIDYNSGMIILSGKAKWKDGDPVNLSFKGSAPDIGPYEYGR